VFEIGTTLREARVRRALTLQQVEEDIKIRVKYVQAMENEDWDVMPGVTYVKGFLRTYSTYLGLDPEVIIGEFRSRAVAPSAEHHEPFGGSSVIGKPHSHAAATPSSSSPWVPHRSRGDLRAAMNGGDSGDGHHALAPSASEPSPASASPKPEERHGHPCLAGTSKIEADGDCWMEVRRNNAGRRPSARARGQEEVQGQGHLDELGAPANVRLGWGHKAVKRRRRPVDRRGRGRGPGPRPRVALAKDFVRRGLQGGSQRVATRQHGAKEIATRYDFKSVAITLEGDALVLVPTTTASSTGRRVLEASAPGR
jgi:hypothetical protein